MNPTNDNDADDKLQQVYNPIGVMQPGERVVCEIRRHPIGLLGIYLTVGIIIVAVIAAAILVPHFLTGLSTEIKSALAVGAVLVSVVALLYAYVTATIYKANRWIVTSDSITQISQVGLFRKQTSQLSLANLEDVTVEQNGLFQSMFGFGLIRAETAGERSKFTFIFCPKPSEYAKKVIAAHEQYIAAKPEEMRVTNQPLADTQSFNQPAVSPVAPAQAESYQGPLPPNDQPIG